MNPPLKLHLLVKKFGLLHKFAQPLQALEEALQSKSRLEKMNEEMKTRFQTILEDTSHDINR